MTTYQAAAATRTAEDKFRLYSNETLRILATGKAAWKRSLAKAELRRRDMEVTLA